MAACSGRELEALFAQCFLSRFNTRLIGGADEPFYAPAPEPGRPHQLFYRLDYVRSALHEIAHWCIAGPQRRELPDFGYWYEADGRDARQQAAFFQVEVRPQALEALFCEAACLPFEVSVDNLDGSALEEDIIKFRSEVGRQAALYRDNAPERARLWIDTLQSHFS